MKGLTIGLFLVAAAVLFTVAGMLYSRGRVASLEDYISARGRIGGTTTAATLLASALGGWILFSPAEAATWGGLAAITGYAIGEASPRLALIPLGLRMRRLIPEGHTLTEFVWHRYGRGMYGLTLLIMVFYLFIFLAAEVTGMALMVSLVSDVPLWLTALIVLAATLAYTAYGGLSASIFTDKLQLALILPFLAALVVIGSVALGDVGPSLEGIREKAPQLIDWAHPAGIEAGLTFIIALLAPNIFHQGLWQRVYAARDERALKAGFLVSALAAVPIVFAMGLFGLAAVGLGRVETPSVALFSVLLGALPLWMVVGLMILGLALVMSSADTLINAVSSIVAVDLRRFAPQAKGRSLLRAARWSVPILGLPVLAIASQGYSVLYLFLIADMVCAAVAFPVFYGLYSDRHDGRTAILAGVAGLIAGAAVFPDPGFGGESLLSSFLLPDLVPASLLGSFLLAGLVPVAVSLILAPRRTRFDFGALGASVQLIRD